MQGIEQSTCNLTGNFLLLSVISGPDTGWSRRKVINGLTNGPLDNSNPVVIQMLFKLNGSSKQIQAINLGMELIGKIEGLIEMGGVLKMTG